MVPVWYPSIWGRTMPVWNWTRITLCICCWKLSYCQVRTLLETICQLLGFVFHFYLTATQSLMDSSCFKIENYGQPLAWKVDSCLAILLKSDLRLLTDLVMASFMQNNLIINDLLPLIRIESKWWLMRLHIFSPNVWQIYVMSSLNVLFTITFDSIW